MKLSAQFKQAIVFFAIVLTYLFTPAFSQTSWTITGNSNIAAGTQYLGTKDPNDPVIRTNALERVSVLNIADYYVLNLY